MSKLLFFFIEPFGGQGGVGKEWPGAESDESSDGSLDNEKPSPSGHSSGTIKLEDTGGNQTCECSCENVS